VLPITDKDNTYKEI